MNQWSEQASKQWDEYAADWHSKSDAMWETGSRKGVSLQCLNKYGL